MNAYFQCISPIDNSVLFERDFARAEEIETALELARTAQANWRQQPIAERKKICGRMLDTFVARKQEIAAEITWQMGRPIRYAANEVVGMEERGRCMIELSETALAPFRLGEKPGFQRWIQREPLGLVLVIAPWNYPYLTAINAIIPAILAGNSVLLKHSAQTPLCAERLHQAFEEAELPNGVFQYLHLAHTDTEKVIADPRVNHVAFTGSVAVGAMVERAAAGRFIGTGLELGGKDPAYVRSDADLAHAVDTVMDGAFFNSGQSCCGVERVYAHRGIYDEFVTRSVEWVKKLQLGRPDDKQTTLGPMVRASAAEFVRGQIREAVAQGARALIDPALFPLDAPGSGYMAPQILVDVNHQMRVMTEESFGPVVGIQKVSSDEEALALMNDSEYGLTAAIFTRDVERGIELGEQIATGTFFLNRCDYLDPELAWTGIKNSGHGCTLSRFGFDYLTRPKSFHIKTEL